LVGKWFVWVSYPPSANACPADKPSAATGTPAIARFGPYSDNVGTDSSLSADVDDAGGENGSVHGVHEFEVHATADVPLLEGSGANAREAGDDEEMQRFTESRFHRRVILIGRD
jgi:hypothetical protein